MIESRTAHHRPRSDQTRHTGRRRLRGGDDTGTTLIELTIALTLMSVFLAMFSTGVVRMFRSTNHSTATATAQSQIHIAFQRLDSALRYATSISQEGAVGSDWYVEYLTTYTGVALCRQLRLTAGGLLQYRQWPQETPPPVFTTVASGLSATRPFTRTPAGTDGYTFERLTVNVVTSGITDARTRQINVTFAALNSTPDTSDQTVCTEGRPPS